MWQEWKTEPTACEDEPNLFHPETPLAYRRARAICCECPFREACLRWGLEESASGVYGGHLLRDGKPSRHLFREMPARPRRSGHGEDRLTPHGAGMNTPQQGDRVRVAGTDITGCVDTVSTFATGCRAGAVRYVKVVEDGTGNVRYLSPGADGRVDALEPLAG